MMYNHKLRLRNSTPDHEVTRFRSWLLGIGVLSALFLPAQSFSQEVPQPEVAALHLIIDYRNHKTIEEIEASVLEIFQEEDLDGGGISQTDWDLARSQALQGAQDQLMKRWLAHDQNEDGQVSISELTESHRRAAEQPLRGAGSTQFPPTEDQIAAVLEALIEETELPDYDGNGVADAGELRRGAIARARPRFGFRGPKIELVFDLNGDGTVQQDELMSVVSAAARRADSNGDGLVKAGESRAIVTANKARFEDWTAQARALHQTRREAYRKAALQASCGFPPVPENHEFVLVVIRDGEAASDHFSGDQEKVMSVGELRISQGDRPVYLMVKSANPIIIQLSGVTDRVRAFVGLSQIAGVGGANPDVVHLIPGSECPDPRWFNIGEDNIAWMNDLLAKSLGRKPDHVLTQRTLGTLSIPSGLHATGGLLAGAVEPHFEGDAQTYWKRFLVAKPGGLIAVSPSDLIARETLEPYRIWPMQAGLAQLLNRGDLALVSPSNEVWLERGPILLGGDVEDWDDEEARVRFNGKINIRVPGGRWKRVEPAVMNVKKKIQVPAGLFVTEGIALRLLPDVPRPDGTLSSVGFVYEK